MAPVSFFRIFALKLKEDLGLIQVKASLRDGSVCTINRDEDLVYTAAETWLIQQEGSNNSNEEARNLNKEKIVHYKTLAASMERRIFPQSRVTSSKQAQITDIVDIYMGIKPIKSIPRLERESYIEAVNKMPKNLPCDLECSTSLQIHRAAFLAAATTTTTVGGGGISSSSSSSDLCSIYTDAERQQAMLDLIRGVKSYKNINEELGINRCTLWRYIDSLRKSMNQPTLSLKQLREMSRGDGAARIWHFIVNLRIANAGRPLLMQSADEQEQNRRCSNSRVRKLSNKQHQQQQRQQQQQHQEHQLQLSSPLPPQILQQQQGQLQHLHRQHQQQLLHLQQQQPVEQLQLQQQHLQHRNQLQQQIPQQQIQVQHQQPIQQLLQPPVATISSFLPGHDIISSSDDNLNRINESFSFPYI